jgi:CRP-like cAMP-binding protein
MKEREIGKKYKNGEIICREGEEGKDMFVIQSGKVKVTKNLPDGELILTTLKEGEFFGEMALFDHLPRSATVKAAGEAVVLSVNKKGFFAKASKDPTLAFNILEGMSGRIRALNDEISNFKRNREAILGTFADIKETGNLIIEEVRRSIKADNGSVMILDEKQKALRITAAFGMEADQKTELKEGEGIAGDVVKTGKIELINNISADSRFMPGQLEFKTLLCAPLKSKNKIVGVINLSNSYGNFFNLDDLKILRVLSIYASIAIENAKLFSTTERFTDSMIKHATLLDM